MVTRRLLLGGLTGFGLAWSFPVRAALDPSSPDIPAVTALIRNAIARHGLKGVAAVALQAGQPFYRGYFGAIRPATAIPVASASKWVAGLLVMSFVAAGKLRLDMTMAEAGLVKAGPAGAITLAQLMSHVSGLEPLRPIRQDRRYPTPASAARALGEMEMAAVPGTVFAYGGVSMQVAAYLVEQVGGADWNSLFRRHIADPLGLSPACRWGEKWGVAGGLIASPDDYERILLMIAARGVTGQGRRILPESIFPAMERNLVAGARREKLPPAAETLAGYGIGFWCETAAADGTCTILSSPGAFGTYPLLDRQRDIAILLMVENRLPRVIKEWRGIIQILTQVAPRP
ncbi:serine hydrolase domain-containing protein [Niveispirillum irakense]|uniref:serine hydrolase domain-containing protein n=1 Tax=Niveispirillum irakense TaxID=34011 RepID=UPI00041E3849|nr:serine hydrolase domain-containing protein [Niveispirillum irakense]